MRKSTWMWLGLSLALASAAAAQTVNQIPKYITSSTFGDSVITELNGNVGIGTTSPNPNAKLDVVGSIFADGTADGNWSNVLGIAQGANLNYMQVDNNGNTYFSSNHNASFNITGGNVGIGTTSPSSGLLDIAAPDKTAESAIAIRQSNSPTFGFDIALDQLVNGMTYFYGVANNTKTALEQFDRINNYVIFNGGNVGIGTTSPGSKLEVSGSVKLTSGSGGSITFQDGTTQSTAYTGVTCGGDYAESVDVSGNRTNYEPGDVLVLDVDNPGKMLKSVEAYSTAVSGIYSIKPGTVGRRQTTAKSPDEVPMAVVGIVPAKVSAENGPIKVGDLLVTSSIPGYAMKGTNRSRMLGAVVGKAMAKLDSGTGVIEVLVTLQ